MSEPPRKKQKVSQRSTADMFNLAQDPTQASPPPSSTSVREAVDPPANVNKSYDKWTKASFRDVSSATTLKAFWNKQRQRDSRTTRASLRE